ncbi:hemagglutinin repeat-containing protein [Pseudomonas sp. NFXW11]|uniref:hemagglutinin repeat-containing protein n=1 Tax=Pseudomonas sp. NFXW11 TaxID=2819531 RepID=UPI003CEFCE52
MDVGQFAFLARQPSAALQSRESFWGLPKRGLAFILANMMFWQPLVVMADGIVVNGSGTHLGQAANGVPIVNIAAPNGSGLSHNQFSDYNVGQQGVILNNATNRTQSTQLGGIILGNSGLGGRAANVILNEVNGGSPSQLKGYTEVAGQSAHVIVANPYGITCNGCGFINTPQATLTTGKPVIENGQLQRYQVEQGSVAIEGAQLNVKNLDRFEIITRSARINADIHAQQLAIVTGANDVDAKTLKATARTANPTDAPQLAIDSSALGGMYAGAIKLVSSEAGVGVKLAGDMAASGGDLQLDANGKLTLARAQAQGDVQLKAQELLLTESVYAQQNAKVVAADRLTLEKNLSAGGNLHLQGQQMHSRGQLNAGLRQQDGVEVANPQSHLQLQGGSLTNTGSINAQGSLSSDLQHLDNQGATLAAAGEIQLKANSLDNRGGQLIGQAALTFDGASLDNRGGTLAAGQALKVTAKTLDNRDQGLILGKSAGLTLNTDSLDNRHGTLQANRGELKAEVKQLLDNGNGKILTGAGNLSLEADELRNQQGRLNAQGGKLEVKGAVFDNSQGDARGEQLQVTSSTRLHNDGGHLLSTVGALALKGGEVRNSGGEIVSQKHLELDVASLLNQQGSLSAESIGLTLSGKLDNDAGLIESRENLVLDAASLSNAKGRLRALGSEGDSRFSIGGRFDNDQGLVEVGSQRLFLNSGGLSNQQGAVRHLGQQGFELSLADAGNAGGSFMTNSRLDLDLADWSNTSLIQAQKIGLKVGTFTQTASGKLVSVEGIEASGNHWINDGGLETDGDLKLNLSGAYQGNGLLKSQGRMSFAAARADLGQAAQVRSGGAADFTLGSHLQNLGNLTAGGDLQLKVDSLSNQGTLGAGNALHIETPTLVNQGGLIFSGADMRLQTSSLTNDKGDIYSLGRLDVHAPGQQPASLIENISGTLESAHGMQLLANRLVNRKEKFAYIPALTSGRITLYVTDNCKGDHCEASYGVNEVYGTKITEDSQRGNLISGAELTFKGDSFENRFSTVAAAGDINLHSNSLKNIGAGGGEIRDSAYYIYTKDEGSYFNFVNRIGSYNAYNDPTSASYNPTAMPLGAIAIGSLTNFSRVETTGSGEVAAAVIQGAGKVDISGTQQLENSVIRPGATVAGGASRVGLTTVDSSSQALPQLNLQAAPDLRQQAVDPLALPGFSLPSGESGLFKVSRDPQHKYLIETNPAFTNLKQFMSSDYLLSRIGFNSDQAQRRLGDGLYEQRLVREAVIARTGQRFIAGLDSDEAMFRYLMDNAIASKNALNLSPGIALTAAQVAALTHDIVWMQEQQVNGEKVLVPVLYMAQANNRLAPNGALIQGRELNLIGGDTLVNQGTLRASEQLQATARNIDNSGLMEANERLALLASQSIRNAQGGILKGKDVSLLATQGDVLNERSKVGQDSRYGGGTQHNDYLDSAARVEASNRLEINAGRDIRNSGSVLQAGGDASLKAGRDLALVATEQVNSSSGRHKKSSWSQSLTSQVGSEVRVAGDLKAVAGRDISAIASSIEATRSITMAATENLTLASAANEQHAYNKGKKVTSQKDEVRQVSTRLKGGGDVTLSAGQELALIASQVTAGDEAYLVAGKNLALKSAEDQDYSFYSKTKKSSSGKKFRLDETESISNVGSLVSAGTNTVLVAGENLQLQGSAVTADKGGAQLVAGKDVQIFAATDSESDRHERKQSKRSWGGLKSSKVEDKVRETRTTAVGSMVSGDTVSVTAGRDATLIGSSLVSTQDLSLQAVRDLTIDAADNTFSRTEMHKQKNRDLTGVLTANKLGVDDITGNQHLSISSRKHNGTAQETTLTGSTIGSSAGNVKLNAGRELKVVASDLVSTKDMSLNGADVSIAAGTETAKQTSVDSSKSLAVGRVIGGMVIDTVKSIRNDIRAAKEADDGRLKAVKSAQALLSAYNAAGNLDSGSAQESEGKPANSSGSLIKIGTELANTRTKSSSEYNGETAKQSTLTSGAGLVINAGGNGEGAKGDIHVIGSHLKAENTALIAKNDIVLQSAQDRAQWDNQNTNSKTSIGASFNIGDQNGFTLDLGAQIAKGMGTGHSVTQVNSTVDTGLLLLTSGQDTTLAGAQVKADTIKADIGGNLNIASRQDAASQKNQQKSAGAGVSLCVPPFCYGAMVTASGNIAGSKMNSDYKAVTDQTGLYAGKGGYDIHVGETTQLQGAVIASDANAEKNRLDTGRLLVSDIKNKSEIKSQAASLSASYTSTKLDNPRGPETPDDQRKWAHSETGGTLPIALKESDHSSTRSAISEGTITVRDPAGINDLVGLNRDTANANQRLDRPDEKAMQERIDLIQSSVQLASSAINTVAKAKADVANKAKREAEKSQNPEQIAAANAAAQDATSWNVGGDKRIMADIASGLVAAGLGGAGGSTAVGVVAYSSSADVFTKIGDYANARHHDPKADSATKAAWAEGGAARVLLHALAGAAIGLSSGNAGSGALGAGASASLMPAIAEALKSSGIESHNQDAIATLIATSLGGSFGAVGGISGSVVAGGNASGVDVYNRKMHREQEIPLLKKKAEELEKKFGKPESDALWEDLLLLASGAKLDEGEKARLDALDKRWGNDPTADWFRLELGIAKEEVRKLADQKIPLTWADGRPIVAHGAPVYAFSSTDAQFKDSSLFNVLGKGYYGELSLAEKWAQYGKQQTTEHAKEILDISTSYLSTKDAADRLMSLAVKNTESVGIFDEVILTLGMPGGKVTLKAILEVLAERGAAKKAVAAEAESLAAQGAANATETKFISQAEAKLAGFKPCCFAAGTMVATPNGERAIETLKIGDVVWSKPEEGGEPFAAAITATHVRTDQPIYRLGLRKDGLDGVTASETLEVTPGHPFYVPARKGFVPLIELKSGDRLQSLGDGAGEGSSITVESVDLLQPQGRTYNLTVDIGHTFYVGKLGTWVHNVGPCYSCSNGSCSIHEVLPEISSGAKASVDAPKGGFGPTYRPADSDQFEKILTSYYGADKTGSRVGNGGLADAVRYEKATGDMLSPAGHEQKAIEVSNRLSDLVRSADNQPPGKYPYSQRDIDFAKQLIKDIDNALGR